MHKPHDQSTDYAVRDDPVQALHLLARALQQLRDSAPLTLRALSRRTHVSASSLSRYFTGQALPTWEVVDALCQLSGGDREEMHRLWVGANGARLRSRWSPPADPAAMIVTPPAAEGDGESQADGEPQGGGEPTDGDVRVECDADTVDQTGGAACAWPALRRPTRRCSSPPAWTAPAASAGRGAGPAS